MTDFFFQYIKYTNIKGMQEQHSFLQCVFNSSTIATRDIEKYVDLW
jgi:hypothetical protein